MAVYILTVVIYIGFLFVPAILQLDSSDYNYNHNNGVCSLYIHEKVIATVGFAWAFLGFGLGALALSFGFAYVDATRQSRREKAAAAEETDFSAHLSDLDTQATYSTLEEGRQPTPRGQTIGNIQSAGSKRSRRSGREEGPRVILEDYVPPMITYSPTDDGVEVLSETEAETSIHNRGPQPALPPHHTKDRALVDYDTEGGATTEIDTVGFVTDLETDVDVDDAGQTSLDTPEEERQQRHPTSPGGSSKKTAVAGNTRERRTLTTISYYDDEDDAVPITSYEVQEETESTTEGPDGFTDGSERYETTDAENYPPPSFETTDIDKAIDLTDNEDSQAPLANLDIVMADSQDPTISLSLTETERSVPHNRTEESETGAGSLTGSISTRGSTTSHQRQTKYQGPDPVQRVVDLVTNSRSSYSIPTSPNRHRQLNGTTTSSTDAFEPGSLTYSTSMGTAIGPMEPLSFVDGGSGNDIVLPYANLRDQSLLESSDTDHEQKKQTKGKH